MQTSKLEREDCLPHCPNGVIVCVPGQSLIQPHYPSVQSGHTHPTQESQATGFSCFPSLFLCNPLDVLSPEHHTEMVLSFLNSLRIHPDCPHFRSMEKFYYRKVFLISSLDLFHEGYRHYTGAAKGLTSDQYCF